MLYQFSKNFFISKVILNYKFYNPFFISLPYLNDILELKSPKLINMLKVDSFNLSSKAIRLNNVVNDIVGIKSNKFDKKYKNNTYDQSSLETKKIKNKFIKKNRKTSNNLGSEDIFLDNNDNLFDHKSLNLSLLKSTKSNKKKEKSKVKLLNNYNTLNLNSSLEEQKTMNSLDDISKDIYINIPLTIQELSSKLNIPEAEIITYLFVKKGISVTINQSIDVSIASEIASSYKFNVLKEEEKNYKNFKNIKQSINSSVYKELQRAPIITILGHVDHGKTTLLDSILKTNFAQKEYGGITQSISGYEIETFNNNKLYKLVFLDTPGHEAFKSMRIRGVEVTDLILLVVAADDGLKPQTIEAIEYINQMNLFYIVVINKIDKKDVNIDRIKKDLLKYNIISNECGGDSNIIEVSALNNQNIDILLSEICLFTDKANLLSNPEKLAYGTILEACLDKKQGSLANVLVQNGTLKLGDIIVADNIYGKVKSITNTKNEKINFCSASSIVQILCFSSVPQAGILFKVVYDEKEAKQYCLSYNNSYHNSKDTILKSLNSRVTLSNNNNIKKLKLIIKTNTQGSLEAILNLLSNIGQEKVHINIIFANFGNISSSDIELAIATNSMIIGFSINLTSKINQIIKKNSIIFQNFNVIYKLFDYIKSVMLDLVDPEYTKSLIGRAIVQTVFNVNKGLVAGCLVYEGKITKFSYIYVYRNNSIVYEGLITSLKHIKDDVEEVISKNECGLMCDYNLWEALDKIDVYELVLKEKLL
uniref:Translation initiation factor IF-2, chloroplastic n=1 Tax=Sonderella linearis TaxID=110477 RepID=A0A1Z1MLW4_9FLOR|nr:translation initiation factor 2 [Sonderella linearis]ARW67038.1 translation initiation factor 2 [Sonderella linearis]